MLTKVRLKFALFVFGGIAVLLVGIVGFVLLTQFVAYFQQGADPASIFRGHSLLIPEDRQARWLSPADTLTHLPSQAQQEEIIAAYWLAWEAVSRAHLTGDTTDLVTYWAGPAYTHILAGIDPAQRRTQIHGGHDLRLTFFSEDGSVVALEDTNFYLAQPDQDRPLLVRASALVIMTLDQGFWRIRQITLQYR